MGHGRVRTTRTVGVTVPAGINDNARLRLANQGEVGEGGGVAGDLYIDIRIKADKQFTRDGDDLHCWIQVPMSWAVLATICPLTRSMVRRPCPSRPAARLRTR